MTITVSQVEAAIAARIAGINGTPYQQGKNPPSFTEGRKLASPRDVAASVAHLRYWVFVERSPNSNLEHDASDGECRVRSQLIVILAYHIGADRQVTDSRLARDAQNDVLRALNAHSCDWTLDIVDAGAPAFDPSGQTMLITSLFYVYHEIPV